ncbi:MAG: 23S rRNA (uracil(1939)-C(5))-methyltransferase RlmD [Candidatus Omnitrophica bacterium]|nr:23S rRNA (uracil(1939)-C(5))-methyltransferase RlmD [Candidatus Omnitrophota bacterium]MCM8830678.1 23S rRNA (uracil(1939)-C(5))-methyltransferase RlmD [Candidatus Omnitrophota bacterium]
MGNPIIEIYDIALPDCFGVGKLEGKTVFVPQTVCSDKVKVEIINEKKNLFFAKVIEYIKLSEFRQSPGCQHFYICDGCCLQNLNYFKQLEIKERYLFEVIKRIAKLEINNIEKSKIAPSPDIYFYRNKIKLFFYKATDKVILGLNKKEPFLQNSKEIFPIKECVIFSQKLFKIIPEILNFANMLGKSNILESLIIRETKFTDQMMLILIVDSFLKDKYLNFFKEKIAKLNLTSAYFLFKNSKKDNSYEQLHICGQNYIQEKILDKIFRIYPLTFLQSNIKATKLLYEKLKELLISIKSKRVLSLYCGAGFLEILIALHIEKIIGVDISKDNILCAKENALINKLDNCIFFESKVENFTNVEFENIDTLILDPPRSGLSKTAIDLILKLEIPKIIYISCNPATLARDLLRFSQFYRVKYVASFDFFPHTCHLESLVFMEILK